MMWPKASLPGIMKVFQIGLWVVSSNIFPISPIFGYLHIRQLSHH